MGTLARFLVVGSCRTFREKDAFLPLVSLGCPSSGLYIGRDGDTFGEEDTFVVHGDLSDLLTSLTASYYSDFVSEQDATLLDFDIYCKIELVASRTNCTLDEQCIMLTLFTSLG